MNKPRPQNEPWFHFDTRDLETIESYPFEGMEVAEYEWGEIELSVSYGRGGVWCLDDRKTVRRYSSLSKAMCVFWRLLQK